MVRDTLAVIDLSVVLLLVLLSCGNGGMTTASPTRTDGETSLIPSDSKTHGDAPPTVAVGGIGQEEIEVPIETFSILPSHQIAPEDILREVSFYASGGDADKDCLYYEQPTVVGAPFEHLELRDIVHVETCGWQFDEIVSVTLGLPDGSSISQELQADQYDCSIHFSYTIAANDPTGLYSLAFAGRSGRLLLSFFVTAPSGPRLYREGESKLLLHSFAPNEHVRLFAYARSEENPSTSRLVAWQEYQTDSRGRLAVRLGQDVLGDQFGYIVVGEVSGEVTVLGSKHFAESILSDR